MAERTRFQIPEKIKHPMGWDCATCFHVVKSVPAIGAAQMKCCRYPPTAHPIMQNGQPIGTMQISPAVNAGEFCGEYATAPDNFVDPGHG